VFMFVLGETQHVSCNTVLPVPHKDKRTRNAKVLLSPVDYTCSILNHSVYVIVVFCHS